MMAKLMEELLVIMLILYSLASLYLTISGDKTIEFFSFILSFATVSLKIYMFVRCISFPWNIPLVCSTVLHSERGEWSNVNRTTLWRCIWIWKWAFGSPRVPWRISKTRLTNQYRICVVFAIAFRNRLRDRGKLINWLFIPTVTNFFHFSYG